MEIILKDSYWNTIKMFGGLGGKQNKKSQGAKNMQPRFNLNLAKQWSKKNNDDNNC